MVFRVQPALPDSARLCPTLAEFGNHESPWHERLRAIGTYTKALNALKGALKRILKRARGAPAARRVLLVTLDFISHKRPRRHIREFKLGVYSLSLVLGTKLRE